MSTKKQLNFLTSGILSTGSELIRKRKKKQMRGGVLWFVASLAAQGAQMLYEHIEDEKEKKRIEEEERQFELERIKQTQEAKKMNDTQKRMINQQLAEYNTEMLRQNTQDLEALTKMERNNKILKEFENKKRLENIEKQKTFARNQAQINSLKGRMRQRRVLNI